MRRRRKKLPPMPPPRYLTIEDIKHKRVEESFDLLIPADKKRVAEGHIGTLDDLPKAIRLAIKNAMLNAIFNFKDIDAEGNETIEKVNFVTYAVKLIDKGVDEAQIVRAINKIDATITEATGVEISHRPDLL